jgi:hypothetical protein
MRLLLRQIAGDPPPPAHIKVEPRLVMRGSSRVREDVAAPDRAERRKRVSKAQ